ncbi:hypothetical protein Y032_0383g385 [Ancylostoma ceylanicum]|uniref:Peptidase M13 C-terminal domain-containing protein n=1 Tax=Ancylostoma ceylanicum TaxID=53326 RepID=A0A016RT21_9BILA|nr:hypothetical protein Y032_0383g385 [Ancylostoma ceylanicum]
MEKPSKHLWVGTALRCNARFQQRASLLHRICNASPYRLHTDRTKHWCGRLSLDLTMALLIADVHSLYNIRVNNVLANIPEFAEAFHCAPGTRMNPGKRCSMY